MRYHIFNQHRLTETENMSNGYVLTLEYQVCAVLTLALISVAPLLLLTALPFPSPPSLFSLVCHAHLFLFSLVFPFLAPPLACEPLLSFSPLQL